MDDAPASVRRRRRVAAMEKEMAGMREIAGKLTRVARYETRDYLSGRIVDLDRAVCGDGEPSGRGETE